MQTFKNIRLQSQQLANPVFTEVKELVRWMGALQAQDYNMAKWAVGSRLSNATEKIVESAFDNGEILRTHVLRPTWHFVAAEDIRWMLKLSAQRIKASSFSRDRDLGITEDLYMHVNRLIEKILRDNHHLTREEIGNELQKAGVGVNSSRMIHFMMRAEVDAIICSGAVKAKKQTYALLDERVAPTQELPKEEALARLAKKYFQSHSPAGLQDFVWWSGLSVTETKTAIKHIEKELFVDKYNGQDFYIHQSFANNIQNSETLYFLPAFDEYLISYKDRTSVLKTEYHAGAFTKNGIFFPIITYNGQVIGNWKKAIKKSALQIETNFFEVFNLDADLQEQAKQKYQLFLKS